MSLEEMYKEAFVKFRSTKILYRGFMLEQKSDGSVSLKDIRNPYYSDVNQEELNIFLDKGFAVGATYLLMESDKRKISRYEELINQKHRLLDNTDNPRKKREHLNTISRYKLEINYYKTQVSRWQEFIIHK